LLPLSPPLPLSATYRLLTDVLTVDFDQLLQGGATAPGNWTGNVLVPPATDVDNIFPGTIDRRLVTVPMFRGLPKAGPSRITYKATPADLVGRTGVPVAAFLDFPLTVIP